MNKSANKLILKRMFKNRLSLEIKKKKLFSTPFITDQLRSGKLKEILSSYNNNSKINDYFPVKGIKSLLEDHLNQDHSNTLMRILTLGYFLESNK